MRCKVYDHEGELVTVTSYFRSGSTREEAKDILGSILRLKPAQGEFRIVHEDGYVTTITVTTRKET